MSGLDTIIHRQDATAWDRFMSSPLIFLARWLHLSDAAPSAASSTPDIAPIRVVCISDTHNTHHAQPHLPEGDILIHAGDLTQSGTDHELDDALAWLNSHPHPHKLFIAGNHDLALTSPQTHARIPPGLTYLENSFIELTISGRKLCIYGSPYTQKHGSWPFQYPRVRPTPTALPQPEAHEIWSKIPPLTDILITHGPPLAHLDADRYGCYALLFALWHVRPKLHVFGHIHAGRGVERIKWDRAQMVYENICAGRTGWGGLVELLWYKLTAWPWKRSLGDDVGTLLVNAAAVAGLRDDQKKGAIVVEI
ncbi:Metallo-dependent phosphatase-like protein [Russula decolorans]|jgi:predicted phosphohydrolase